ncbi:hypothetical protein ABW19_dt0209265 [Dactylella cylindrospora]|nr:hypothetical protein ABW19_dt0209265 [Dactylella cylindrospora]
MEDRMIFSPLLAKYPWELDATEVVNYLQQQPKLQRYFQNGSIDPSLFIQHDITGAVLLSKLFTQENIKNELGVRQLGVQITLFEFIQDLRDKYSNRPGPELDDTGLLPPIETEQDPAETRIYYFPPLPDQPEGILPQSVRTTPSRLLPSPASPNPRKRVSPSNFRPDASDLISSTGIPTPVSATSVQADTEDESEPIAKRHCYDDGTDDSSMQLVTRNSTPDNDTIGSINPGSVYDQLEQEPSRGISTQRHPNVEDNSTSEGDGPLITSTTARHTNLGDVKGTPRSKDQEASTREHSANSETRRRARKKHPADPTAYLGNQPITALDVTLGFERGKDVDNWAIVRRVKQPPGAIRARNSIQQAFLLNGKSEQCHFNRKLHLGVRPFSIRHVQPFQRVPVTVISQDSVKLNQNLKEYIEKFPSLDIQSELYKRKPDRIQLMDITANPHLKQFIDPWETPYGDNSLEYIEAVYSKLPTNLEDNECIPVHYERGDSPGLDELTIMEMRAEEREKRKLLSGKDRAALAPDEVMRLFDQMKDAIITKFHQVDALRLEKTKYRVWLKGTRPPGVEKNIETKLDEIKQIDKRLERQLEKYMRGTWHSNQDLERQVKGSTSPSWIDQEKLRWEIQVLQGTEPEKPPRVVKRTRITVAPGIRLVTETFDGSDEYESDGMSDFIVQDDSPDKIPIAPKDAQGTLQPEDGRSPRAARNVPSASIISVNQDDATMEDEAEAANPPISKEVTPPRRDQTVQHPPKRSSDIYQWYDNSPPPANNLPPPSPIRVPTAKGKMPVPCTPPPKVKQEPKSAPIISVIPGIIDLTLDDDPPETSRAKPRAVTLGKSSSSGNQRPISLEDYDADMMQFVLAESRRTAEEEAKQRAIASSLRESSAGPSCQPQLRTPPSDSLISMPYREPPVIVDPQDKQPPAWKRDLQKVYEKAPDTAKKLQRILKEESKSLQKTLILFACDQDDARGNSKKLGIPSDKYQQLRTLANLYVRYSFPTGGLEDAGRSRKATLNNPNLFTGFLRELTPLLDDIVAYEQSKRPSAIDSFGTGTSPPQSSVALNSRTRGEDKSREKVKHKGKAVRVSTDISEDVDTGSDPDCQILGPRHPPAAPPEEREDTPQLRKPVNRKKVAESDAVIEHRRGVIKAFKYSERRAAQQVKSGQKIEDLVNPGHYKRFESIHFPEDDVPLYPFQKEAIQFMWRKIIVSNRGGVLLAHTMGMGKTRQVITLLGLIAKTASSANVDLYEQIPKELRKMRALIVAPPGLLDNWLDEIKRWGCEALDPATQVPTGRLDEKVKAVQEWVDYGTLLLIGYENFVGLVNVYSDSHTELQKLKAKISTHGYKPNQKDSTKAQDLERDLNLSKGVRNLLLQTPTIVVADEAHKLKNSSSKTSRSFQGFKTAIRIAMTGSPLANNLREYFNIVRWIDQDYLDSHPTEISKSNVMQKALQTLLNPITHRCNIMSIKKDLPPKTEFLIALPPTELQLEIYKLFTQEVRSEIRNNEIKGFFDFIKQLSVLLNHPAVFRNDLEARLEKRANKNSSTRGTSTSKIANRAHTAQLSTSANDPTEFTAEDERAAEELIGQVNASIFQRVQLIINRDGLEIEDPRHSYRIVALMRIISSCIEIREKVLVFSHSLHTLSYIQDQLDKKKIKHIRLDGDVSTAKRQQMAREFSTDETFVFLISTKAGGLGLNIQSASRVVIFDFDFSPQDEEQAVGRAYRLGQTRHVYVYRFRIGGTYEDVIHNKAIFKLSLANRVVDKKNPLRHAKRSKTGDWFRPPSEVPRGSIEKALGKDAKVMETMLAEEWIRGVELQETYEMDRDEPLNEREQLECNAAIQAMNIPNILNNYDAAEDDENGQNNSKTTTVPPAPNPTPNGATAQPGRRHSISTNSRPGILGQTPTAKRTRPTSRTANSTPQRNASGPSKSSLQTPSGAASIPRTVPHNNSGEDGMESINQRFSTMLSPSPVSSGSASFNKKT